MNRPLHWLWMLALLAGATVVAAEARDFRSADNQVARLPDCRGGPVHGAADCRAQRRPPQHPGVSLPAARRGEGHDRGHEGRRHRHKSRQCRADRRVRSDGERAGDAVPVPLARASAQRDRQRHRPGDSRRLRAARLHRADLLRFRRAIDLQQRAAGPLARRSPGHEDPRAAIATDGRHDQGARRRADRTVLRTGAHRPVHQADRRRRKQLAFLRHHRPLPSRRLLHPDRASDGAGGPGDVDQGLGQPQRAGPQALPRCRARIQQIHARTLEGARGQERRSRPRPPASRSFAGSTGSRSRRRWPASTPRQRRIRRSAG